MPMRDRAFFAQGVNNYVPAMQHASNLQLGVPNLFSLGTPAAVSATIYAAATPANAVAGTKVAYGDIVVDSRYGRTLRLTPSADPGNAAAVDIVGFDYLGQPMVERFTGASGSTAILYGRKAFYRVSYSKIVTAASNAVTWGVGSGFRFGLPYKCDVPWAKENGILVNVTNRDRTFYADRSAAEAVSGSSKWIRAPFPGFVKTLIGTPDGGGSTNDPIVTVKLATVAIIGLTVTIDTSDVAGLTVTDTPTTLGYNANNRFRTDALIEIACAAAASAKGDRVGLELTPTQFSVADLTDPALTTSGDPRGTYESLLTPDGSELFVGIVGDNSVSAALNNGGLHGVRHITPT